MIPNCLLKYSFPSPSSVKLFSLNLYFENTMYVYVNNITAKLGDIDDI